MQPAHALQENVHGTQVRDQQVGVNVQRLLERLRAYHDSAARRTTLPQLGLNCRVQQPTVLGCETAVVHGRTARHVEQQLFTTPAPHFVEDLPNCIDGVPNHQHLGTLPSLANRDLRDSVGILEDWHFGHGHVSLIADRIEGLVVARPLARAEGQHRVFDGLRRGEPGPLPSPSSGAHGGQAISRGGSQGRGHEQRVSADLQVAS